MKCQIPSTSAFGVVGGGSFIHNLSNLATCYHIMISCKSDRKHRIDLTVKKLLNLTEGVNLRIAPRRPRVSCVLVISRRANCWAGWNRVHGNCALHADNSIQYGTVCCLTLIPWYGCFLLPVRLPILMNHCILIETNSTLNYWAVKSLNYFRDFQTYNTPLWLMRWSAYHAGLTVLW